MRCVVLHAAGCLLSVVVVMVDGVDKSSTRDFGSGLVGGSISLGRDGGQRDQTGDHSWWSHVVTGTSIGMGLNLKHLVQYRNGIVENVGSLSLFVVWLFASSYACPPLPTLSITLTFMSDDLFGILAWS